MRDPYEVLGVQRTASAAEIKKAYRRLAKKLHPDANKNDPKSALKFAELNAAHEIVGDEDKRKAFDSGAIDAEGKPRFQGFEGFGAGQRGAGAAAGPGGAHFESFEFGPGGFRRAGNAGTGGLGGGHFEDILSSVFGGLGGAGRRGSRPASFDFEEMQQPSAGRDVTVEVTITLPEAAAGATRRVQLPTGKEVDVKIPPGLADGKQIRLKNQGFPGVHGGRAGDALVTIRIAPHPLFKVEGTNLRVEVPLTLYEAVLGAQVRVPTLNGSVDLAVPPGTSSGRAFRLRGKGLPSGSGHGDLFATARIVLPEKTDPELESLMREWREGKAYNPRSAFE
ncbi:MAG: hypothetical protein QOD74_1833 [Variibacter sp.]|jgi:DnaJ-class molecular chaperone|nr:hypothetical protein [Variibacter sp.]